MACVGLNQLRERERADAPDSPTPFCDDNRKGRRFANSPLPLLSLSLLLSPPDEEKGCRAKTTDEGGGKDGATATNELQKSPSKERERRTRMNGYIELKRDRCVLYTHAAICRVICMREREGFFSLSPFSVAARSRPPARFLFLFSALSERAAHSYLLLLRRPLRISDLIYLLTHRWASSSSSSATTRQASGRKARPGERGGGLFLLKRRRPPAFVRTYCCCGRKL